MALPAWRRYRWPVLPRPPEKMTLLLLGVLLFITSASGIPANPSNADHITAIYGDKITLNCDVNFPDGVNSPYVVQWWRKDKELPIYIWYDDYPEHASSDYVGRVSRVKPGEKYGLASLTLSDVKDTDRGWYNCKVLFLNRGPNNTVNGTWYHIDVHAKPHFVLTPDPIVYVSLHDSIILSCTASGTPLPEIRWFKDEEVVKPSHRVVIVNDGTELRISNLREPDLGDYTCIARNGQGKSGYTTKVVMAGGAVILRPPENVTALENEQVMMPCEGQAEPKNLTTKWYKDGLPVNKVGTLGRRTHIMNDGTLQIRLITSEDGGRYTCEITNGIGRPIQASAYITVEYPAKVVFTPTPQYIPKGLNGVIRCEVEANPPITYITWRKDNRLFQPFKTAGMVALKNGSILIDMVTYEHAGDYQCQPFNKRGSAGLSAVIQVQIRDPPTLMKRPESEYVRNVGGTVSFSCQAMGTPTPKITWRRVDGIRLPLKRTQFVGGEMTMSNLRKTDHGVYECLVANEVATIVARTALLIERTTPHAPTNLTMSNSETFAVTIEWMPGYSGCSSCAQTYKIRYREKDSKFPNWIELPVNPPDARKIQIHNLTPRTKYEFQVIGTNEFGDGMFSEIIEAQTKDITYFDIRLLPRDHFGNVLFPQIPKRRDGPLGERPTAATNITLTQEAGGWVLRWDGPKEPDTNILYYTIEIKKDSQGGEWIPLTDQKIDVAEASYMIKNMGTAKAYLFRVFSHGATSFTISEDFKYDLPENVKRRAVTAGLIGGILFFIVAIVVSVCTVKICNKRRRRKHDRAYNMVARRVSETRNGGHIAQVPLKRFGKSGIPVVSDSVSLRRGLLSLFDTVSHCVVSLKDKVDHNSGFYHDNNMYHQETYDSDELDYSGGYRRNQKLRPVSSSKRAHYSLRVEYPTQPGYGVNRGPQQSAKGGFISRTKEGKFVLENEVDEGGFEMELPPNRFRTRSVAIVAGYSPERLYSNMPPGAFVVESGVYKVGADREWERPEPIYWKQVVFGARNAGSDGSGTMPRRRVGRLVEEDIQRLRALEQPTKPRFQRQDNLELKRQSGSTARLRASSPMDQNAPLMEFVVSPGSEISTVQFPSSAEKSMPSTLLTSRGLSSISSPNFTGTTGDATGSSRSLRQKSSAEMTPLGTIPEQSYSEMEFPQAAAPQSVAVQADVHSSYVRHPGTTPLSRREREHLERELYWERTTYRNADNLFPNYALNYPAPIHHHPQYQGSISPSIQYPDVMPPRYEEALAMMSPQQAFASAASVVTPLATSSPPAGERPGGYIDMTRASQHLLGLPFKTSTRTSLHDYENMRYHLASGAAGGTQSAQPQQEVPVPVVRRRRPNSSNASSRPHSDEVGRQNRESTVIDGELLKRPRSDGGDAVSLVSEVLDAEVTALTNSSPGSSNGSTERKSSGISKTKLQEAIKHAKRSLIEDMTPPGSSSSGIASKNSSQNQTTTSSLSGTSSSSAGIMNQTQQLSIDTLKTGLEPIPEVGGHTYYYYDDLPFYENWPPPKPSQFPPPVRPRLSTYLGYQFVPPPEAASAQLLPPLTPHQSLGQAARPQYPTRVQLLGFDRSKQSYSPAGDLDTSLDTPPSAANGGQGSRPGSAHSAPLLDLSIDRHYEFDSARTPTDDISLHNMVGGGNQPILLLPHNWNRPYLGYNPRRDRELGSAAAAARRERVFSDSEIYSPVFPRGRPEPRVDITARVKAMKREFAEYRTQQLQQQINPPQLESQEPTKSSADFADTAENIVMTETSSGRLSPSKQLKDAAERLESLI